MGAYQLVCLLCVVDVSLGEVLEAAIMVEGVVAHLMTFFHHLAEEMRVFPHIVANHEEGRLSPVMAQGFENERRGFWNGTVVEREIYGMFMLVHAPQGSWKHPTQPE